MELYRYEQEEEENVASQVGIAAEASKRAAEKGQVSPEEKSLRETRLVAAEEKREAEERKRALPERK